MTRGRQERRGNRLIKGLVSIVTPCYNGEGFLARFLNSILAQTYPHVELFLINDGSTDKTEEIALGYRDAFAQRGYAYTYIYQENGGQASAVNRGLGLFEGEYLTWPDSDDTLTPDALAVKVAFMDARPEYGGCVCGVRSLDDKTDEVLEEFMRYEPDEPPQTLFWDLFWERDVVWCPGAYFIRSEAFFAVNPTRHIFESREGQNYQILLPMLYHYHFGYIREFLYHYYFRWESHSNIQRGPMELYTRKTNTQILYTETINAMPCPLDERALIEREIARKFLPMRLRFAAKALRLDLVRAVNGEAKRHGISLTVRGKAFTLGVLAAAYGAVRRK